jgi:mannonate dehydratase
VANILLNGEGRNHSIDLCKQWIRNYGNAGFDYSIGALSVTGVWSNRWHLAKDNPATTRNGLTREFNILSPDQRMEIGTYSRTDNTKTADTLLYGREYSEEEIVDNYVYFCRQIAPVLEDHGVHIGFHPDDPPAFKSLGGVARINGTFDQIKRNIEIAESPNIGHAFCAGVWLEGGDAMGMEVLDAIRYFIGTGKIWEFNFRNVSGTLPSFVETFMDNGYYNMYPIMKTLVELGYSGLIHQDHRVDMIGGNRTYDAYANAYIKAMLQAARYETA